LGRDSRIVPSASITPSLEILTPFKNK